MDRSSRPGPEPTSLESVGDQWHYALVVVQAGDNDDDDDDDETHQVNFGGNCTFPLAVAVAWSLVTGYYLR